MNMDCKLSDEYAKKLYQCVAKLPIVDYHNHLCVADIVSDRVFENITQLWISVDPYKHRAMRILGIHEKYITGDATDYEKFEKWYECLPRLAGNVLYDWSIMEFQKVFEIELYPFEKSARQVWDEVNEVLRDMSAKKILDKFNIQYCAPCASLVESIELFDKEKGICPSLRGDDLVSVNLKLIKKLEQLTSISIDSLQTYKKAVSTRLEVFIEKGCRYTDHALDDGYEYFSDDGKNEERFQTVLCDGVLSERDKKYLSSWIIKNLAELYAKNGLTMQLHIGARRHTSTRLRELAGPTGGYAAIGSCVNIKNLTEMLDDIEKSGYGLPKTLLFSLNPADNAVMSNLSGSYSKDGAEAIISQGPAWWWCDHYQGIWEMLDHLSVYGVMSTFIGMTTDSRSLLSFVRHDYFRRILCQWMAEKVKKGLIPDDFNILSDILKRMCYSNAAKTIGIFP